MLAQRKQPIEDETTDVGDSERLHGYVCIYIYIYIYINEYILTFF